MQRVDFVRLLYEVKRTGCAHFHWTVMYCYFTDWCWCVCLDLWDAVCVSVVGKNMRDIQRNIQKKNKTEEREDTSNGRKQVEGVFLRLLLGTFKGNFSTGTDFCRMFCTLTYKKHIQLLLAAWLTGQWFTLTHRKAVATVIWQEIVWHGITFLQQKISEDIHYITETLLSWLEYTAAWTCHSWNN